VSVYPKGVEVHRFAIISPDERYRYFLARAWGKPGESGRSLGFIMLNPSTADAERDDNTIRRCVSLATAHRYTGIHVVNLFALRTKDPRVLWMTMDSGVDVVGPENDHTITEILTTAASLDRPVVAAWGAAPRARERVAKVCALSYAERLHAFATTGGGAPRHPLYLPRDCDLTPWKPPE